MSLNYRYKIDLNLNNDILQKYKNIRFCCFNIINKCNVICPFISYYLIFSKVTKEYTFPVINTKDFPNYLQNKNYIFKGFYEYDNTLFGFFETHAVIANLEKFLISEMVNNFTTEISKKVTQFFSQNPAFCFLHKENNYIYETPTIGYKVVDKSQYNYTLYCDGFIMDDNYSFFVYDEKSCNFKKDYKSLKFALFLGKYDTIMKQTVSKACRIIEELLGDNSDYDSIIFDKHIYVLKKQRQCLIT